MRPYALLTPLALLCAGSARAESTRMIIEFAGRPAGENVYESNPDGTFTSATNLSLGTITIRSSLSGKMESGRLVKFIGETIAPNGDKSTITWDHGKAHIKSGKVDRDTDLKIGSEPYFGNLHPQFTASALAALDFGKKSTQELKCFCPDGGAFLSAKFTPEGEKVTAKGTARMFDMVLPTVQAKFAMDNAHHVVLMDVPGQKLRFIVVGWESLVKDPLAAYPELSQPTFKIKVEKAVKMKTRDGVNLVQDVIRPDAEGKFPVILSRTPYGRESAAAEGPFYASRGYVFVSQDCRGRNDSEGEWDPFMNERKDGYDAVQWATTQPWSDGNVGMIGGSYGGMVQWQAAVENPPGLKCIIPQVSPPDAFLNIPYDNGIFFLYGAVWWAKIVAGKTADMSSFMSKLPNPEGFSQLPLSKVDNAVLGQHLPFYAKWLKRDVAQDWKGYNYESDLKNVKIPALHISGWWDGDEIGTMTNWQIMRSLGRTNQWLVYGPWTHLFNSATKIGDTDFGPGAVIDLDSVNLRWFDTWLKHKSVGMEKLPHVRAFVTGANKWVESKDWPLVNSKPMTMYLAGTGPVEGSSTTGTLELAPPKKQNPSTYRYDPHVSTIDKKILEPDPAKATLKTHIPKKLPGVAFFQSAPLKQAMTISGPLEMDLRFSTSAQNTDFFAQLLDLDEKGVYTAIGQQGKFRCSYLQGFDKQRPLKPGKIYQVKFRMWDTARQFAKGHRICLMINSSMYPLFARNLGTIEPIETGTKMIVQDQKLYHDKQNPSSITFRVTN